jgi:hypothetical protein
MEGKVGTRMKRLVFDPEHEQLRETARQFIAITAVATDSR